MVPHYLNNPYICSTPTITPIMGFKYYLSKRTDKYHIRLRYSYNKGSRHDFMVGIYLMDKKHFNGRRKNKSERFRFNFFG